jgi:hypothetical protein
VLDPADLALTELTPPAAPAAPVVADTGHLARTFGAVIGDHWCFAERAFGATPQPSAWPPRSPHRPRTSRRRRCVPEPG